MPPSQWLSAPIWANAIPLILVTSLLLSFVAVWVVKNVAVRVGFTDGHNSNTGNPGGAAMGGGVAVVLVLIAVIFLLSPPDTPAPRIAVVIACACALGLVDDAFGLPPWAKLLGQSLCAGLYLSQSHLGFLPGIASALFLVLASNAWNLVDVMDGLLGWIGTICLLGVCLVLLIYDPLTHGIWRVPLIAAGALAGFLIWNKHPARVLLGDAGSLSLGMLYGILVVEGAKRDLELGALLLLPGLIPFLEVGFLVIQRSKKRIPFYQTTPDHFALRLKRNGYAIPRVIRSVVIAGAALSVTAALVAVTSFNRVVVGSVIGALVLSTLLAYRFFSRLSTDEIRR